MKRITLAASFALVLGFNVSQANAQSYTYTELGTLGGTITDVKAINAAGQVIGNGSTAGDTAHHAILWNSATATDLTPGIPGWSSVANGINNSGQVAGDSVVRLNQCCEWRWRASVWNGTSLTILGTLPDTTHTSANAINNSGQVAGSSIVDAFSGHYHATVWNGTTPTDLGIDSVAYGINDLGQVAGSRNLNGGYDGIGTYATVWNGTIATTLELLAGTTQSEALAINNSGQTIGWSLANNEYHATLWNGTVATDFGAKTALLAINNSGVLAGSNDGRASIWNGTTVLDLNSFLDASMVSEGWVLTGAFGINDSGWVVGEARNRSMGITHAFLLTPVPEPETYAMILAGLGFLAFARRRGKQHA